VPLRDLDPFHEWIRRESPSQAARSVVMQRWSGRDDGSDLAAFIREIVAERRAVTATG
jgi:hypothetical protein